MYNDAAPEGKERKYARPERERRFLFGEQPNAPAERAVQIVDRYLPNTRIRLRRVQEVGGAAGGVTYKLTQKLPTQGGAPGLITTMYLTSAEYDLLAQLPAVSLGKTRFSIPPLGVDVFGGNLTGLVLGEAEFADDRAMAAFAVPDGALAEVTHDERFTGGRLVTMSGSQLAVLLAEYGA